MVPSGLTLASVLPYAQLAQITRHVAACSGIAVRVLPMPPDLAVDRYGAVRGRRTILYAARAPLWVVAHEVAHVVTPLDEPEHGPRWDLNRRTIEMFLESVVAAY